MNAPRRIALCVDDFGLHAGIDAAVLELAGRARLSAVSCMVGLPRWRSSGKSIQALDADAVDVGLHLDLTEAPLDATLRRPVGAWIAQAGLGLLPMPRLRAEIDAQLAAFVDVVGREPAHVDGHQHVHQLPGVRDLLIEILERRAGAGPRPWLRNTRAPRGEGFKPGLIAALGSDGLAGLAAGHGFRQNRRMLGVYDFHGDAAAYTARLAHWLDEAGDGDLLMCHPSHAVAAPGDAILAARTVEAAVLGGDDWPALLAHAGVELAPISRLLAAH
jgi:chitin disaccharide deacetylase